jgi:hypothetical protein
MFQKADHALPTLFLMEQKFSDHSKLNVMFQTPQNVEKFERRTQSKCCDQQRRKRIE